MLDTRDVYMKETYDSLVLTDSYSSWDTHTQYAQKYII